MKYLKKFKQEADYQSFKGSDEFETPNVSYVTENNECYFEPHKELIVNKCFVAGEMVNYQHLQYLRFEYPVDSDVMVKYVYGASFTTKLPEGAIVGETHVQEGSIYYPIVSALFQKGMSSVSIGLGSVQAYKGMISITPSKDSTYIYTTDMAMYNPS